jgi:rubrerythrin
MTATPTQTPQRSTIDSPVDDATYDILMALASKLEAIDTYRKYADDGDDADLWQQLAKDDRRHADRLLEELRRRLTSNR